MKEVFQPSLSTEIQETAHLIALSLINSDLRPGESIMALTLAKNLVAATSKS